MAFIVFFPFFYYIDSGGESETVDARHRLRKKLSIPKDTDLNDFLQSRPS